MKIFENSIIDVSGPMTNFANVATYDLNQIFSWKFSIFELEEALGRSNVLIEGTKTIIDFMELDKLITMENLDSFLTNLRDKYNDDNFYHNSLHGFDVCQTICMFLTQSDITELVGFTDLDILSLILSGLSHDVGHPGLNNTFQINSFSEISITYNDKSVLENFHVSETFKILMKPHCNIISKLENSDFRIIRKRIIETILATDMMCHAKVLSLMKNRIILNNIKNGENAEKIIDKESQTFVEDQQEIINYLVHTADISHNAKRFEISYKWTYFLMEEFWRQGDIERSNRLPISFLCDRFTAEVPKSQIGFITGIIIPSFEVLNDFLPSLGYFKDAVMNNLEEWRKIVICNEKNKDKDELLVEDNK
jgi:hypothetical protein